MALANYSDLKTSVAAWIERDDLTNVIPDFITAAEQMVNYGGEDFPALRCTDMQGSATIALTNGAGAAPADFLAATAVSTSGVGGASLELVAEDWAKNAYPNPSSGYAAFYTIVGSTITTYPYHTGSLNLTYYKMVPALSDAAPTNWLLTKAPMIYLYGALLQTAPFTGDDGRIATWGKLYTQAVRGLAHSDAVKRLSGATTRVRFKAP